MSKPKPIKLFVTESIYDDIAKQVAEACGEAFTEKLEDNRDDIQEFGTFQEARLKFQDDIHKAFRRWVKRTKKPLTEKDLGDGQG
jgi:hypothetical protein